jgi:DNA-binding MarR family transcriptional regulator
MLRPQTMGSVVNCLEELGMVGRQAHPTDGRQYLFGLTQVGVEIFAAAASFKLAWLTDAVTTLSPTEQEILAKTAALISHLADA